MTYRDLFEETYIALSANKIRSGLTVLGIVIGISSVIAMISIGQGAQGSIQSSIQSIGSNLLLVSPGAQRGPGSAVSSGRGGAKTLTREDAEAIQKNVLGIQAVAPDVTSRYQVTAKGKNTNTSVVGTTASYTSVRNIEMDEGTFITDDHDRALAKVAVLGPTTRNDLFGEGATGVIGQTIRIKGMQFRIIGITKAKGGTGFGNQDDRIFIPLKSAQRFLSGDAFVSTISIAAIDAESMSDVQASVTSLLLTRHKINDPTQADFSVFNQADIVATASSITQTFTLLLGAVAGISLIVGGIGIMNMMLTTVTERTKEIGLRKAIGAKQADISKQFLAEAVALTFIGGVLGVVLGWIIAYAFSALGLIQTTVSITSILLAFGVSACIGIVFGYYPAQRAARLNPIEALRYE